MSRPAVSVIVPTFDRARFLPFCLESIFSQTLRPAQVIVVDDGSRDATGKVLDSLGEAVTVIRKNNGGKASAVNRGLAVVEGDYVWVLDDDDVAFPDALERFVRPLEENRGYGFSYSTRFRCRSRPDGTIGPVIGVSKVPDVYDRTFAIRLMRHNFLGGATLLVRRVVYEEVGGYDEDLLRSQDYEMAIRVALRYRGVRAAGGPTYMHRQHRGVRGPVAERFSERKRHEVWRKYNRAFMRRLYGELPLETFAFEPHGLSGDDTIVAVLSRAGVMASHGLDDLVLRDLRFIAERPFEGTLPPRAIRLGDEVVWRFASGGGSSWELIKALRSRTPAIQPLLRSMRRRLGLAAAWNVLPRSIRTRIRLHRNQLARRVGQNGRKTPAPTLPFFCTTKH